MIGGKDISASRVARCLILMTLSFFIVWVIDSGHLESIVHPRMKAWVAIGGLLALLLSFGEMLRIDVKPREPDSISRYYPIIFAIAIVFLYLQGGGPKLATASVQPEISAFQSAIENRDAVVKKAQTERLPGTIIFDDERYWPLYNRLYDSPQDARGHKIVVKGFFDKPAGAPANVALVGRNLMWCCSADMAAIGFLVRGAALDEYKVSEWVEASGTLDTIEYDLNGDGKEELVPFIELDRLKRVDKGATSSVIFPY